MIRRKTTKRGFDDDEICREIRNVIYVVKYGEEIRFYWDIF